jgi:hypothetical protein
MSTPTAMARTLRFTAVSLQDATMSIADVHFPLPTPTCRILKIDVNAFHASIEPNDDPSSHGKPVADRGHPAR